MGRFDGLKASIEADKAAPKRSPAAAKPKADKGQKEGTATPKSRDGKRGILGYFSPELGKALRLLAVERDTNVQALMGEAFDLLLTKYKKHPFGER
jgi:hypothetical protein